MRGGLLPAGTVTFLFTDIEGSTKLWEAHPDVMRVCLARHDAIMREAIADARGYVFKTIGDAFCAAFSTAPDTMEAVLKAQLALVAEPWPGETPIKVRMAVHTGAVESRDDDYFGPPVNRVARLVSAAHGMQVLLSQTTYELTRDSLPPHTKLKELGEHRLKDLGRPERVYQLLHPQLPSDFPELRSLDNPDLRHNLPRQLNLFVGREKEIAEVKSLMAHSRLLTLTGAGGSGKTRLSLQVAADLLEEFDDGVWLVELASLTDPSLVPQAVSSQLGQEVDSDELTSVPLVEQLKSKRLLLVLDNCEHVLDACATLVETLIRQCPNLRFLASSREGLGITGEQTYRVPSLALPNPDKPQTAESLSQFDAVRLFVDRALLVQPDFQVTNQNAPALASLCVHLDGIPLAIELAAARVRSLSIEEIDSKLDQRFRLLTGGSRTALPRQQTLRALVDWSYQMLSELEREAFEQLSVFVGGWTMDMAERVCGEPIEEFELLDLITHLVDKSLLNFDSSDGGRYSSYETIREFAREQLAGRPDAETATLKRHMEFMAQLGLDCERKFRTVDEPQALQKLVRNAPNVVAALTHARQLADLEVAAQLTLALGASHQRRGYPKEGAAVIDELLSSGGLDSAVQPEIYARLLCERASLALDLFRNEEALPLAEQAAEVASIVNDASLTIRAKNLLGQVALARDSFGEARSYFNDALQISDEAQLWIDSARLRNNLGIVERRDPAGDKDLAAVHYRAALEIQRKHNHRRGQAETLNSLGVLEQARGNLSEAAELYLESARIETELDHVFGVAKTVSNYGEALVELGELGRALKPFAIAEQMFDQIGSPYSAYTRTMLRETAAKMGITENQVEDLRARCGKVTLEGAVTASLQSE